MGEIGQKPRILYRRFRKEIVMLPTEYNILGHKIYVMKPNIHDFLLNYDHQHDYDAKHQMVNFSFPITFLFEDANRFLNMKITNMMEYPFKPPKIIFKDKNLIHHYCSNLFIRYKKYLKRTRNCCLVCSSVLSGSNWTCITSMNDVFYEMLSNFIDIRRAIEMLHMEKIMGFYITGDTYLTGYMLSFI